MIRRAGFTMVELMVVVAVVAIMAGLAVPEIVKLTRRTKVSTEASTIASEIGAMRAQAVTRGFPHVMCIRGKNYAAVLPMAPNSTFTYRKVNPTPPALGNVGYDDDGLPAVSATDDRVLDTRIFDESNEVVLSGVDGGFDDSKTAQLAFDMNGAVSAFKGDHCEASANPSRAVVDVGTGLTFVLRNKADNAVDQPITLRPDGTVLLP